MGKRLDKIHGWVPRMMDSLGSSAADGSKVVFGEGMWVYSVGQKFWVTLGAWVIDLSGPKQRMVQVAPRADAVPPLMSDDGKKVVYFSWLGGAFIVNADGSGRSLIHGGFLPIDIDGTGSRIVGGFRGEGEVRLIKTDGTGLRNLTNTPSLLESSASITPDGKKVALGRTHGTQWGKQTTEVMSVNADGTGLKSLARVPGGAMYSAISADGSRIVMMTGGPTAETRGVFLVRADTRAVLRLTQPAFPRISGNGKRLLSATRQGVPIILDYALPDLKALGPEQLGETETLQIAADPGTLWLLGLSDTKASIPLPPFGTLALDPRRLGILGQGIMGRGRIVRRELLLPSDPLLVGLSIVTQALAFRPSLASGAFTNLVEIRIQNRIEE
ncbi:MAG: TolB family protein [Planctomycetota bacterium]